MKSFQDGVTRGLSRTSGADRPKRLLLEAGSPFVMTSSGGNSAWSWSDTWSSRASATTMCGNGSAFTSCLPTLASKDCISLPPVSSGLFINGVRARVLAGGRTPLRQCRRELRLRLALPFLHRGQHRRAVRREEGEQHERGEPRDVEVEPVVHGELDRQQHGGAEGRHLREAPPAGHERDE